MADSNLIMTLAKVIIAAAWADGEIQIEEMNSLKDLLFALPQLTALQWAELDMYIETAPNEAERAFLLEQLQEAVSSEQDKALALGALENMLKADGVITEQETQMAQVIRQTIDEADIGFYSRLAGLIRGPVARRSQAAAITYNREQYFDEFIKNKVYYAVRRHLDLGEIDLHISDDALRKLGLAGGLLARVARTSEGIAQTELDAIIEALRIGWGISHEEAAVVAQIALSSESQNLDYFRLTREFVMRCELDERKRFLDSLFAVAVADGEVSPDEMDEIREIARSMKLSNQSFVQAKMKIPRNQRSE